MWEKAKENKLKIFILVVVIVGAAVCVKSCVDKREPDVSVAYIGYEYADYDGFEELGLGDIAGDVNGDGEAVAALMEISFNEELPQSDISGAGSKMAAAVGSGAARVYLIDEDFVRANVDNGVFASLDEFGGEGIKNADGEVVAIDISENEKAARAVKGSTEGLYIALRKVSEVDAVLYKDIDLTDEAARRIVEYMLEP